jgi:myo-inositol-1(or 4)-monophosphatase
MINFAHLECRHVVIIFSVKKSDKMINNVIEISRIAGSIIRDGFGKQIEVGFKTGDNNLVTEIDLASEKAIINYINKHFPDHNILSEESGTDDKKGDYTWVIDPLDGTTNFAHGLPIFSVSIGVVKGNEIICGAVYDVMHDVLYSAVKGEGAYRNGKRISVNKNSNLKTAFLVTGFPYNVNENPDHIFERFIRFLTHSRAVRRLGSAAIDFCYVAEGIFDGFWEVFLNPWDICAGKLICEEAGGRVTDFMGNKSDIYERRVLASNGMIHDEMVRVMNKPVE